MLPRPRTAEGTFLRVVMVNDVYKLENNANVRTAIELNKSKETDLDMVVVGCLAGDFMSPSLSTSLDGGKAMMDLVNTVGFDFISIGNHEFDISIKGFASKAATVSAPTQVLNSNVLNPELAFLPRAAAVAVGGRTAVFGGYCTSDASIYAPNSLPKFEAVNDSIIRTWEESCATLGAPPDVMVPLTHQLTSEDKATCVHVQKHCPLLAARMPVLVAGHDHSVFIDEAGASMVVKVGVDAINIGVIDIWWTSDGALRRRVSLLPCEEYAPHPEVLAAVARQNAHLDALMGVSIATLPCAMSSQHVRFEPSGMATWLLSKVHRAYVASHGAHFAMINAGAVRAGQAYAAGDGFTMGDLYKEFAFDTLTCVIELPGDILQASVISSRTGRKPDPSFLHFSAGVVITPDTHEIVTVGGETFDASKTYKAVSYRSLLTGMNEIQPMTQWCGENLTVPDEEICRPAKEVVMQVAMADAWRNVVDFQAWDTDHDGSVDEAEMRVGVANLFKDLDVNGDGLLDLAEVSTLLRKRGKDTALAVHMIEALDADHDGRVSMSELMHIAPFHGNN